MTIEGTAFGLLAPQFSAGAVTPGLPVITGLSGGVAIIGSAVSAILGGQPATGTIQWYADGIAIAGATAASFTPTPAQEATALSVAVDGAVSGEAVAVHHPLPISAGALAAQSFDQGSGITTFATSGDFTFAGVLAYQLVAPPTGVTIDPVSGIVSFDTDTLAVQTATPITVRAADATNAARFTESGFALSIQSVGAFGAPVIVSTGNGSVTLDATGTAPPPPAAPSVVSTQTGAVTLDAA